MFTDQNVQLYQLEQRANSGARWFFWIAALSLITSITGLSGSNWRFFISLGITQVVIPISEVNQQSGVNGRELCLGPLPNRSDKPSI